MAAQDECDSLGHVYVWGEVVFDTSVRTGSDTVISSTGRTDILLPKPLESNLVLDVYRVDCGGKHAALVMKNGEVFTWGKDSGGCLGRIGEDCVRPRPVELFPVSNVDFVACGEFHTCAVTTTGELYTWGDGTHNVGLLGHGNDVGHWIPKRVSGALEGLQVAYVSCGTWHTALITSMGQLFTFGDGLFGVLGHGDQKSVSYPREVESLSGLKTIAVACGVWHTAAIVEVTVTRFSSSSAGKLFTWGDGDRHHLGHGDKKTQLKPTCVATLIDHDFHRVACGHRLTVALTTSGQVFSMGCHVYGQLGNPRSDGRIPCLVEDKISGEQVIQIACGSYHVAVLTGRSEVFTWGKGANGRLGHGDIYDRKVPTLVEALKDRAVRYIACGANFTAAICQHKWVSGAGQSQCSSCRQPFGFTRRRRNCYNCGLVHCNACTSRKALRAALALSPGKPYRVCDSCFLKLNNASDPNSAKVGKASLPINMDMIRNLAIKAAQQGKKTDELSFPQNPQRRSHELYSSPTSLQVMPLELLRKTTNDFSEKQRLGSGTFGAVYEGILDGKKVAVKLLHSMSQRLDYEEEFMKEFDNLRRLNHPNIVQLLGYCYEIKRVCIEHEGKYVLADETYRALCFDYMHNGSLRRHLDDKVNRLDWPTCYKIIKGTCKGLKYLHEGSETPMFHLDLKPENILLDKKMVPKIADFGLSKLVCDNQTQCTSSPLGTRRYCPPEYIEQGYVSNKFDIFSLGVVMIEIIAGPEGYRKAAEMPSQEFIAHVQGNWRERLEATPGCTSLIHECRQVQRCIEIALECVSADRKQRPNIGDITSWLNEIENEMLTAGSRVDDNVSMDAMSLQSGEDGYKPRGTISLPSNQVQAEWIEEYEPGVYITLTTLRDGTRDLKRVRFSRRRFGEHQAENWWNENREKVYERYNVKSSERVSSAASTRSAY